MKHSTAWYLRHVIAYHPRLFYVTVISYIFQYSMSMVPVLIAREIFNALAGEADFSLEVLLVLFAMNEVVRMTLFAVVVSAETIYFHHFWAWLRANLFDAILQRPGAQALPYSSGEALSRFRDDVGMVQSFMSSLYNVVATGVFSLLAFGIMFSIDARITLIVFTPLALVTVLVNRAQRRIVSYREHAQETTAQVTGFLGELLGAVQAVKTAGAEQRIIQAFQQRNHARRHAMVRDKMLNEMLHSISRNITNIGTGVILLVGAQAMRSGQFNVGDYALFVFYLGWTTYFTTFLGQFIAAYKQVGVSFQRLEALLQSAPPEQLVQPRPIDLYQAPPPLTVPPRSTPLLTLTAQNLSYCYPGSEAGIHDVSLRLAKGSFTVITGSIGSGKTTLLRVLLGLLQADHGAIYWNGDRIDDPGEVLIPPRCAYTPQVPHLFSESLRDNLLMGLPLEQVDLPQAIASAVMEEDVALIGLETPIGARGVRLSGGQVQRAAAARMFVRTSDLLVFDDISSALDVQTEHRLWDRLFARPDVTCLAVSHRQAALQRADQIYVMDQGRIIAQGTLAEVSPFLPHMMVG